MRISFRPLGLDESGHYTGHYTYKCAPGFRETIKVSGEMIMLLAVLAVVAVVTVMFRFHGPN